MDYKLDEDFDIEFTDWGDFKTVDGREEFEQQLHVRLHDNQRRILGDKSSSETTKEKIRQIVARVAKQEGVIERVASLNISDLSSASQSINVELAYDTGETFTESL
jgi:hypothetical protein